MGGGRVFVGSATGGELIWKSGRANQQADQFCGRQGRFDSLPLADLPALLIGQFHFLIFPLSEASLPHQPIISQDHYL